MEKPSRGRNACHERAIGRRAPALSFGLALLLIGLAPSADAAFAFRKPLTINGARVLGGPHLDFPVLVSVVDASLANPPTGGVRSPSGYDIQFRAANGVTILDHEIEYYDGASGTLVAWVRFPGTAGPPDTRIQNGVSTSFFVYYGDPSVTCARNNPRLVWDASYRFVLHLSEPAGNPLDSSRGSSPTRLNPNGDGTAAVTQNVAGRVAGAIDFTTPPGRGEPGDQLDYYDFPTGCFPGCVGTGTDTQLLVDDGTIPANQDYTIESWVRMDTVANNWYGIVGKGRGDLPAMTNDWMGLYKRATPSRFALGNKAGGNVNGTTTPVAATWYHVVVSSDATGRRVYVNGALEATGAAAGHTAVGFQTRIGDDSNGFYLDGQVDEARFSNVARSGNWITTTFQSHDCPSPSACPSGVPANRFVDVGAQAAVAPVLLVDNSTGSGLALGVEKDGGLAWGDFNGDSCLDVIVNRGGNGTPDGSRLLVQGKSANCTGTWTDVTACLASGLSAIPDEWRSLVWGDFNNDGVLDFARNVTTAVEIYRNNGTGTTVDASCPGGSFPWSRFGVAGAPSYSFAGGINTEGFGWIDWNRDGNLDLYFDDANSGMVILQNSGPPGYTFAAAAGTGLPGTVPFAPVDFAALGDVDADGDVDILVRNGFTGATPQDLWLYNAATSQFQPAAGFPNVVPINTNKGGVALCDLDNDGDFDVVWTDSPTTDIYEQTGLGSGSFVLRLSAGFPVDDIDGVACGDLDNDNDVDIVVTAGVPASPGASRNDFVVRNDGGFTFTDISPAGFGSADGEGVVLGDYDRDGDLDVLINQWSTGGAATNELWRNETNDRNYLMVRALWDVDGVPGGATRDAIGATVTLRSCAGTLAAGIREVNGGSGHGSQSPALVHFGLPTSGLPRGGGMVYEVGVRYLDGTIRRKAVVPKGLGCYQELTIRSTDADDLALCAATAVELQSFTARAGDSRVDLEWETASELDNLGFHVYRGRSPDGPWTRLSDALVPGLGSSPLGRRYAWPDPGLVNGERYYYRLEDVDTRLKSTFHGPLSAVPDASASPRDTGDAPRCGPCSARSAHGDPSAVGLRVLQRSSRHVVVELETGGFYTTASALAGTVRVEIPGFDTEERSFVPALPLKRALVDAPVGRSARIAWVRPSDLVAYPGLRPEAVGSPELDVRRDGTVRAARRAAPPRVSPRGLVPEEAVRLVDGIFQGESKKLALELRPLRFDPRRNALVLARRLRVRVDFAGRQERETGRGSRGRRQPRERPAAGETLAFLHASATGLHAAAFESLFAAGTRPLDASTLRLTRQGEAVAFHVEPDAARFGPGSRLFFHVERTVPSTAFSGEVSYALERAAGGVAMAVAAASPGGAVIASSPVTRRVIETDHIYQPGLLEAEDVWLWEAVMAGTAKSVPVPLAGVAAASPQAAAVSLYLQGGSDAASVVDHHVSVFLNGVALGETRFDGKRPTRLDASVPASALREGPNELTVANLGDTGVPSVVFLDRLEIAFPRQAALVDGRFDGRSPASGVLELAAGFAPGGPAYALDVSDEARPRWLVGLETRAASLRLRVTAGERVLVASPAGLRAPRVTRPLRSSLRSPDNQADYLLVAPEAFLDAAQPLLERRREQGLSTRAASLEEIASAFGAGAPSAEAVRDFVAFAFHSWRQPSPRYLLLLGDASYDPRNFTGTARPAPLPALWEKTAYLWTVSDPALAAVNGEDPLPDLAVGRLPAATVEEARALVQKTLDWEDGQGSLDGTAVLVADDPDPAGDFEADVEDVAASLLAERAPSLIFVSRLGGATRAAILDAFDEGASTVSYVGHGGAAVWASENVLNSWDTASLRAQSRQPLLLTWNCLNGYFVAPGYDSLAEAFVKVAGRGAVAAYSPSGLSQNGAAHALHRALVAELTRGAHGRLGDALLAAQEAYAEGGLMPELVGIYQLLGDPGLRIR